MKKLVLLATAALVAMMIFVPTAMAQTDTDVAATDTDVTAKDKATDTAVDTAAEEGEPGQADVVVTETTTEATVVEPLPKSGGPSASSVLLPAAGLLLGTGVLAYALVRRR